MTEEQGQSQQDSEQPQQVPTKTSRSKARVAREQAIAPQQSIWPFALACALGVLLIGFIIHPIILAIGLLLVAIAIIGWGLERR